MSLMKSLLIMTIKSRILVKKVTKIKTKMGKMKLKKKMGSRMAKVTI